GVLLRPRHVDLSRAMPSRDRKPAVELRVRDREARQRCRPDSTGRLHDTARAHPRGRKSAVAGDPGSEVAREPAGGRTVTPARGQGHRVASRLTGPDRETPAWRGGPG